MRDQPQQNAVALENPIQALLWLELYCSWCRNTYLKRKEKFSQNQHENAFFTQARCVGLVQWWEIWNLAIFENSVKPGDIILMDSKLIQILSWNNLVKVFLIPWIYSSIHQVEDLARYAALFCSTVSAGEFYITVFCSFCFSIGRYQEGMVSSFDYYLSLDTAKVYVSSAVGGHFDQTARKERISSCPGKYINICTRGYCGS